jgi:hypothetical protein
MTRINLINPSKLTTKHLVAEYREITRLPNNLKDSLSRKGKPFDLSEIPSSYVLGKGHVKFFYNKMLFLQKRFELLVSEMIQRGYNPTYQDSSIFTDCDPVFFNDYYPSQLEINLNIDRLKQRSPDNSY